jgi:hypothetical protein
LVPRAVQDAFLMAAEKRPDLMGLDERTLFRILRGDAMSPTPTDNRIRLNFWREYDMAQTNGRKINVDAIHAGICHKTFFYNNYLTSPTRVAWLLCMPASYDTMMEEMLQFGVEQLRDILELPNTDAGGKLNLKLLELKAKIVALVDQRQKGGIIQRVEQKSMNLLVATTDKGVAQAMTENTMEALEKKMKELEARERRALNLVDKSKGDIVVESE